jgi:DNA-directed RNA polymerase specialized sigma24 family protein
MGEKTVTYEIVEIETGETRADLGHELDRAFLTAHLMTGNREQAEVAVLEAISSWDPESGTREILFEEVLRAAVRNPEAYASPGWKEKLAGEPALPAELQAVLRLSPRYRQCVVLRILLGRSREACARLLGFPPEGVDDCVCRALRSLAERSTAGFQQLIWTREFRWSD